MAFLQKKPYLLLEGDRKKEISMKKELTKKEEWVRKELEKLYPQLQINEQKVLGAAYSMYGGDLLAVAIEFFLNKPIEVQVDAFNNNKAENFITYIMNLQAKSQYTKFYHQYKKYTIRSREYYTDHYQYDQHKNEDNSDDDRMVCIKKAIKELNPFERMLVEKRIIEGMSYEDIRDIYDIPYSSLSNELQKVKRKLKAKCSHIIF